MYAHRLDLQQIERSLLGVQRAFPEINARLHTRRDVLSDRVLNNMLAGYAFVDRLLAERVDVFALGRLGFLLEINHLVLCGPDPEDRRHAHRHIEETERVFYDDMRGGIRHVMGWYERNANATVWRRAAGVYVQLLSEPQLFIEGNHRSGSLIMSYLLAREGKPPFVLTVDNAEAYFKPSTLIRLTPRTVLMGFWRMPRLITAFSTYLETAVDPALLVPITTAAANEPGDAGREPAVS